MSPTTVNLCDPLQPFRYLLLAALGRGGAKHFQMLSGVQ